MSSHVATHGISVGTIFSTYLIWKSLGGKVDWLYMTHSITFLLGNITAFQATPTTINLLFNLLMNQIWQNKTLLATKKNDAKGCFHFSLFSLKTTLFYDKFLCCLYLCIFNAFLVLVTTPQRSQEIVESTWLASIWFLISPLFVLSYWHSTQYQTPLRLSFDILLSMMLSRRSRIYSLNSLHLHQKNG